MYISVCVHGVCDQGGGEEGTGCATCALRQDRYAKVTAANECACVLIGVVDVHIITPTHPTQPNPKPTPTSTCYTPTPNPKPQTSPANISKIPTNTTKPKTLDR